MRVVLLRQRRQNLDLDVSRAEAKVFLLASKMIIGDSKCNIRCNTRCILDSVKNVQTGFCILMTELKRRLNIFFPVYYVTRTLKGTTRRKVIRECCQQL